jgi:hypothetical protein
MALLLVHDSAFQALCHSIILPPRPYPSKILYQFVMSPTRVTCPTLIISHLIAVTMFTGGYVAIKYPTRSGLLVFFFLKK